MTTFRSSIVFESVEPRQLLSAGQLDPTFGSGGSINLAQLFPKFGLTTQVVQKDGKILLGGEDASDPTKVRAAVIRLNSGGSVDQSFGTNGEMKFDYDAGATVSSIQDIAIQSDGKIVVVGEEHTSAGDTNAGIARLTTGGALDHSFSSDGVRIYSSSSSKVDSFLSVRLAPGGKIVAGGDTGSDYLVARFTSGGSLDTSFNHSGIKNINMGGNDVLAELAVTPSGKIIAAGELVDFGKLGIVQLTSSGGIDGSFGSGGRVFQSNFETLVGGELLLQSDGSFVVTGQDTTNGSTFFASMRDFSANGKPTGFKSVKFNIPNFERLVAATQDAKGNFDLLGGTFARNGNTFLNTVFVLRATKSGKVDTGFGDNGIATIDSTEGDLPETIATTSDGSILAGVVHGDTGVNTLFKVQGAGSGGSGGGGATLGADGTLTITGTDSADNINVNNGNPSGDVTVVINGATHSFADAQVLRVVVNALGGNDAIFTGVAGTPFTVNGGEGNDHFSFRNGDNHLNGNAGNDFFTNDDSDDDAVATIDGGSGTDTEEFGGIAEITVSMGTNLENFISHGVNVNGNDLNNTIDASASVAGLKLNGGGGNDRIIGGSGDDLLHGGSGNDSLTGGTGSDDLFGDGGSDTDDDSTRGLSLNISLDNIANDGPRGSATEHDNVHSDIETVLGGSGADRIVGNPFANKLVGNGGNDSIFGGDGNDTLLGGSGTDQLDGQGGTDVVVQ